MYRNGDYLVICDRCGFPAHRSECRKQWNGLLVHAIRCYDKKHPSLEPWKRPQEDKPIGDPRPQKSMDHALTSLSSSASIYDTSISVDSVRNVGILTPIGITLDNNIIFWSFSTTVPTGNTIILNEYIIGPASSGNVVYIASNSEENFISMTHQERLAALL